MLSILVGDGNGVTVNICVEDDLTSDDLGDCTRDDDQGRHRVLYSLVRRPHLFASYERVWQQR